MTQSNEEYEEDFKEPIDPQRILLRIILVGLIGCGPFLAAYFFHLWQRWEFRLFPLALAGALFFYWRAWREAERPPEPGSAWVTIPGAILALFLFASATLHGRLGLGYAVIVFGVGLWFWSIGGWPLVRESIPGAIMAMLGSTLILQRFHDIQFRNYEGILVQYPSLALCFWQVPNAIVGNEILLPGDKWIPVPLENFVFTFSASTILAFFYVLYRRRSVFFLPVVLATAFVSHLIFSMVKILGLGVLEFHFPDALNHDELWVELVSFALIFIFGVLLPDALVASRFISPWEHNEKPQKHSESLLAWTEFGVAYKMLATILIALGLVQIFLLGKQHKTDLKRLYKSALPSFSAAHHSRIFPMTSS